MTWVRIDDKAPRHPKIAGLSDRAFRVMVSALCYVSEFTTDGLVPSAFLATVRQSVQEELITAGVWRLDGTDVHIHDYHDYNPTRDEVLEKRQLTLRRVQLFRDRELRDRVRVRDGDECRYCGRTVAWTDRRSDLGGTYDHVDPSGDNSESNLVVCCRGCNSRKSRRTPDQAGMPLRPISVSKSEPKSDAGLYALPGPARPDQIKDLPPTPLRGASGLTKREAQELRRHRSQKLSLPACPHDDARCANEHTCIERLMRESKAVAS